MNKTEYLGILRHSLASLPDSTREDALQYYNEYFDEAGEENYFEVANRLGDPRQLAFQLKNDAIFQQVDTSNPSARTGLSASWKAVIGICAAPIAVPIALMAAIFGICILLTIILVIGCILLSLIMIVASAGIIALSAFVTGCVMIIMSFPILVQFAPTGLFLLGAGIASLGISVLMAILTGYLGKWFWKALRTLFGRWLPSIIRRALRKKEVIA